MSIPSEDRQAYIRNLIHYRAMLEACEWGYFKEKAAADKRLVELLELEIR